MKKQILISFLSFLFLGHIEAQDNSTGKTIHSFTEWNFGIATIPNEELILPGTSFLWGKTIINENNFIIEYEAGFALPTIITGKLGIGKQFNSTNVVLGIRPFPFNFYLQSSLTNGKKGYWIVSIEYNPLSADVGLSFGSEAILNFGYRWQLNRK